MNKAKLQTLRDKSAHRGEKKSAKKERKWEWKTEHYCQILNEFAYDIHCCDQGDGAMLCVRTAVRNGRHVMQVQYMGIDKRISKEYLSGFKHDLETEDRWKTCDIFEDDNDQ
jgi:hypothetical protein